MSSPIVLLSGCVGFGEEYTRIEGFSNSDVGAIALKGTTLEPRLGNPPHRIAETPSGMLNAIGLQNPGVDVVVNEILPALDFEETRFLANVCGSTIEDYVEVTHRFDDSPIDGIEINISCPNIKEGGVSFGQNPNLSAEITQAVKAAAPKKPLIVKLTPNVTDIATIALAVERGGADAISLINTLTGMAINIDTRRPVLANITGGLSGPAIRPVAVRMVHEVARAVDLPIIGMGGITSARDALEFILAGASAVAVGTMNFVEPAAMAEVIAGLADYCRRHQVARVADLVGALQAG